MNIEDRRGAGFRVLRLLVGEVVLCMIFYLSGPILGSVPLAHFQMWLRDTDPQTAFMALVRLGGLAVSCWLIVTTVVYLLGSLAGLRAVVRCSSWVTLPFLRRVVDGVAAASILAAAVASTTGMTSAAPLAQPIASRNRAATTMNEEPSATSSATVSAPTKSGTTASVAVSRQVVGRHLPHPRAIRHVLPARLVAASNVSAPTEENGFAGLAAGTKVIVVQPGDCLSVIAQRHLASWQDYHEISALNRGKIQADGHALEDDHWIYPGWVLVMPPQAVGTVVVGAPAPAAALGPSSATASGLTSGGPPTSTVPPATVPSSAKPVAPSAGAANGTAAARGRNGTSSPTQAIEPAVQRSGPLLPPSVHNKAAKRSGEEAGTRGQPGSAAAPVAVIPAVGIGAVVAAGVVWKLARRRREQMLGRWKGANVPALPAEVELTERRARAIADGEALVWIDAGLRYLGRLLRDMIEPPSVVLVRAGAVGLEVMVDPPAEEAPGRFQVVDNGVAWVLDPALELGDLEELAGDAWPPLPALVTVGESDGGTVLANLEHAGSLVVDGDAERCRGLLLQMLVELTSYPWTDQTLAGVHVLGNPGLRDTLVGVDVDDDPMFLAQVLDQMSDRFQHEIGSAPSVVARRAIDSGWEPHVTIAFPDAQAEALRCSIEAAVPDRSGVAVVCAGPTEGARWRLHVSAAGVATLSAGGDRRFSMELRVDPDAEAMGLLATDLRLSAEAADVPAVPEHDEADRIAVDVRPGEREIVVLGPVGVAGGPGLDAVESKRRRPGLAVLAYLATHNPPVPSAVLEQALWPLDETKARFGGAAPSTVNNVVTNARKILGRGPNGEDLLVFQANVGYRLAETVTVDWLRFQQLTSSGGVAGTSSGGTAGLESKIASWRRALELLEGVPFAGFYPGKFFEWVGSERLIDKMTARVVDIAQDLGTAALEAEDWATVEWAVLKGLALDPVREELFQLLMHAEGRAGRPQRVEELYGDLCAMLAREVDPLQVPSDTTEAVWKEYTARQGAATARL